MADGASLLELRDVRLERPDGSVLLDELDFDLGPGGSASIMGPSGSGKTTLLNCVAGLACPVSGRIAFDGVEIASLSRARRCSYRLTRIGLVFQFGELLPELTVVQNVSLPLRLAGVSRSDADRRARDGLDRLGLLGLADRQPTSLSGGEAQRVAIVRAVAHEPALVLADEPTGMLDEATSGEVVGVLAEVCSEIGAGLIVATHDPSVAAITDGSYRITGARLRRTCREPAA